MNVELPPTSGGPATPAPARCEWCRERTASRRVELATGKKVAAGWKAAKTIKVCPHCEKIIERQRA